MAIAAREPLGVGRLFSKSFSLLGSRVLPLALIPLVPTAASGAIGLIFFADILAQAASGTMTNPMEIYTTAYMAFTFASSLIFFIMLGTLTLACYDVVRGESITFGAHISRALRALPALFVLTIVVILAVIAGMVLLVVPGIYLAARLWVLYPAIMIGDSGWGGIGRAWNLSREYSWPLVGLMLMLFAALIGVALGMSLTLGVGLTLGTSIPDAGALGWWPFALQLVLNSLIYSYTSMLAVVIYQRLREIKEGSAPDEMTEVFA